MSSDIKYLLPYKNFYKANLHCYSALSDGRLTPEELKEIYKKNGYSILAITDKKAVSEKVLCDDDFLTLSAFSFGAVSKDTYPIKSPLFTAISLNEEPAEIEEYKGGYDIDAISSYIAECKKKGYFTTFCSPARSCLVMPEYLNFSNADAMEIMNYSSLMQGYDEYSAVAYDNFTRRNHRLFALANDGNKNSYPLESKKSDSFGNYTYVNSDSLDYASIARSLKEGCFYASEGPEIKALWIKGDTLNIRTSEADKIVVYFGRRGSGFLFSNGGVPLTAASFKIGPKDVYVRCIVTDKDGRRAFTKAYYIDEIM